MAESTVVRTARDGVTVVSDSGASNSYTVSCEPGDFNYAAPGYSVLRMLGRGDHKTPRRQDQQMITLGWSVHMRDISSTVHATLPDICEYERVGTYVKGNWTSTFGNASDVFGVDVEHTIDGSAFGESDKTLHFDDVSLRGAFTEGFPSSYAVTGESSTLNAVIS